MNAGTQFRDVERLAREAAQACSDGDQYNANHLFNEIKDLLLDKIEPLLDEGRLF